MTGGAGFSRDAMKRTRENRDALKGSRNTYFRARKNKEDFKSSDFPESDPEVVQEIKEKLVAENQLKDRLNLIILAIVILTAVVVILFL
ncbi:hypothetical protein OZ410_09285 [Robiginitalea sp. M366]|uniref:hypothetical protein n=1 Tax=Robiginitalea aestuariiviva TaxID=3036903 RepID=UPI00240D2032|nr:hypothetical protein [Robiginitalea aestuariiviva]MDG1572508.1 hypothetical protein [Robiginitalea aestuariiviva]